MKKLKLGHHVRRFCVVVPPLITHDSWSPNRIIAHKINFLPKPYFSKKEIRKLWSKKNAFSISIVTKKLFNFFFILAISIISDINLSLSPLCLFLTYPVCCKKVKSGRTFLVSLKELLILSLDLHRTKKWVSNFVWISYLYLFFLLA